MSRTAQVTVRLLGAVEALVDGVPVAVGGRNPKVVLSVLALEDGRVVPSERLAEAVWGDDAVTRSPTTLHVHLSNLRKALSPAEAFVADPPGYRIQPAVVEVDAEQFGQRVDRARRLSAASRRFEAIAEVEAGLALWRGPALAGLEDVLELEAVRHRLEELRLTAVAERVDLLLGLGRHAELVPELEALVTDHPFREGFVAQLMLALYRCGRQREALAAFRAAEARLGEEAGLDPGPDLVRLEQAILVQDPEISLTKAADEPSLRWLDGDGTTRQHALVPSGPELLIGRDETCAIHLGHDPAVSRRHARIERRDRCWWVDDHGRSTNGTFLNGRRVVDHAALGDGDLLRCGETALLVRLSVGGPPAPAIGSHSLTLSLDELQGSGRPGAS